MLKQHVAVMAICCTDPAAFGRLCVETSNLLQFDKLTSPAAFGRLCVETYASKDVMCPFSQPPSGGCVLKHLVCYQCPIVQPSRLRAAVC